MEEPTRKGLLAAILVLAQTAYAGDGSILVIAAGQAVQGPAARMKVGADYAVVPVMVQNDSKDPVKRNDAIEKALRSIRESLAPHRDIKVMPGVVSLSVKELYAAGPP